MTSRGGNATSRYAVAIEGIAHGQGGLQFSNLPGTYMIQTGYDRYFQKIILKGKNVRFVENSTYPPSFAVITMRLKFASATLFRC
jgi:hypothetical protein